MTSRHDRGRAPGANFRVWLCALAGVGLGVELGVDLARAQDASAAGMRVWRTAGCAACHGTFGEGGGGGEQPEGPNLRRTALDAKALRETIRCGRPGSKMPYFLKGAYTDTSCWNWPAGIAPPADVTGPGRLDAGAIDSLVAYLTARVAGMAEPVTLAECASYYGSAEHAGCDPYR